eukprot:gene13388-28388_t
MRRATKAGSWYEDDESKLDLQLGTWLRSAECRICANVKAIIAPHAGYSYSGSTAAHGYINIHPSATKTVIILGPSHHAYFTKCRISSATLLETPLGNLIVNNTIREELISTGQFDLCSREIDEAEHSIEMHLPYVAKIMKSIENVTVIPIMVGDITSSSAEIYGDIFSRYFENPDVLFIISSDFCHWGRRFDYQNFDPLQAKCSQIHEYIRWLDHEGIKLIESKNRSGFVEYLERTHNTICGRNPIILLLATIEKSNLNPNIRIQFNHYAQSSAVISKNDSSVSYASAVVELLK